MSIQFLTTRRVLVQSLFSEMILTIFCFRLFNWIAQRVPNGFFFDFLTGISLAMKVSRVDRLYLDSAEGVSVTCQCLHGCNLVDFPICPHTMIA